MTSEPENRFNREKFLAVIHFIIECCSAKPEILGKTKLHKCLYYSDMSHFFSSGEPVTGVDYLKAPHGPVARYLDWGLSQLSNQGLISISTEDYFGLGKFRYELVRGRNTNQLSELQKDLIKEVVSFVCEHTAKEISEISHAQPWQEVRMGQVIPYSTAYQLFPDTTINEADLDWARSRLEAARQ